MAWLYVFVHEYSQADARARRTLELYPGSFQASCALGLSAIAQGNDAEAIAALLSDPWRVVRRAHVIVRPPRP